MTPGMALTRTLTSVAMTPALGMVAVLRMAEAQAHALSCIHEIFQKIIMREVCRKFEDFTYFVMVTGTWTG